MGLAEAISEVKVDNEKFTMTREKVSNTLTEELIIGICSPIGSLRDEVVNEIEQQLREIYGYTVKRIKISKLIEEHADTQPTIEVGKTQAYTKLMSKIKGGNSLRKIHNPACLAELAISEINIERMGKGLDVKDVKDLTSRRTCYIIDSLKNVEELFLLRSIYKDIYYQFSIFSPDFEIRENLRHKGLADNEITDLMATDDYEKNEDGQNVRDTFVDADFFFRVSKENTKDIESKVKRYLHLIFESAIVTPKPNEIAMYEAKSAAGNSACMSRQVGAAITNSSGEIISRGWNDVPKYGGNLYKDGDTFDNRCIHLGVCSNDKTKDIVSENILEIILNDESIKGIFKGDEEEQRKVSERLRKSIRKSTKVKDLIEFSRAVHAEMHAIIMGSQLAGNQMKGGKLYCTTYPCHNCGRHIVVAGIQEIYYIEPYVKSLCISLHSDAMTENESDENKVKILMYDGVAPRRFLEFFMMKAGRKDSEGKLISQDYKTILPKSRLSLQALSTLEAQVLFSLRSTGLIK
ncbi:MAG: anti-phage dCTP deaminase [Flavipsychrobacter sp.]|nr:anti-phage dCTP deaminase [Flavipsychrobacter sp.]